MVAALVLSFTANSFAEEEISEVIVTGTRAVIQDSINLKRSAVTIAGVTSYRKNGGATEVPVRGLGPCLGTTVVNGREATNGGGNRAVSFSIFPSEMFNSIAIHKTQSASYIEGAVSGQVHLNAKRPIDYGKERLQLNQILKYRHTRMTGITHPMILAFVARVAMLILGRLKIWVLLGFLSQYGITPKPNF